MTVETIHRPYWAGGSLYNPEKREILLHLRDGNTTVAPHTWAFFGGGNEGGELPLETFIRELKEEIGFDARQEDVRPLWDYYVESLSSHRYVFYVESGIALDRLTLGEGAGFEWVPLERALERALAPKTGGDLHRFISEIARS